MLTSAALLEASRKIPSRVVPSAVCSTVYRSRAYRYAFVVVSMTDELSRDTNFMRL